jgi:hypothetical protein
MPFFNEFIARTYTMTTLPIKSGEIVISSETAQLFADTYVSGAIAAAADGMTIALPQSVVAALWLADPAFPAEMDAHCISSELVSFLALRAVYRCNSDEMGKHMYAKLLIKQYQSVQNKYIETELCSLIRATSAFKYEILPQNLLYKFHDVYDASGESPLMRIVDYLQFDESNQTKFALGLIRAGCDCSYVNSKGETALMAAIGNENDTVVEAIIATGRFAPSQIRHDGDTALMLACMTYMHEIALAILATGHGLPNHKSSDGQTALEICMERNVPKDRIRIKPLIDALTACLPK